MSRPLRLEAPGEFFHVLARGNDRGAIFVDDADREAFLGLVAESLERYFVSCHAYCLMGNHYHLILQPSRSNLSAAMRFLNGEYAQRFNRRHDRTGHLFEGRFKNLLIDRDAYLTVLSRYIVLNPVRASLVRVPEEWRWSSYRAMAGFASAPRFLTTSVVLGAFGDPSNADARRAFRDFVARIEPGDAEAELLSRSIDREVIAGSDAFLQRFEATIVAAGKDQEYPARHRHTGRPPLDALVDGWVTREDLVTAVRMARERHGYTPTEISIATRLSVSTVGRLLRRSKAGGPGSRSGERIEDL